MLFQLSLIALATGVYSTCPSNQFERAEAIAITCLPETGQSQAISLTPSEDVLITHFPAGTKDVEISLTSSEGDLDVCLFDNVHNSCVRNAMNCVAGFGCHNGGRAGTGAAGRDYAGVNLYFNGDDTSDPIEETIRLTGTLNRDMWLKVIAYSRFDNQAGAYSGMVTWSHGGIDGNCDPDGANTCVPCDNYDCSATPGSHPQCNGSQSVTCVACPDGQVWNADDQECKFDAPLCAGPYPGGPQPWSISNKEILNVLGQPQDGCCAPSGVRRADPLLHHYCTSSGDPHIKQFDQHTNHAYINGDYWFYNGNKLRIALRHVNHGTVAGNNAFHISGPMLEGHSLEFHDRDTVSRVNHHRAEPRVFIDGTEVTVGGQDKFQHACNFFLERHLVCKCQWNGVELNFVINDKTMFKFDRWTTNGLGWNNVYFQMNPDDKDPADMGMCTLEATTNNEIAAGKAQDDPYPDSRLSCNAGASHTNSNDPFTLRDGYNVHDTLVQDYFCQPADQMDRRRFAASRRRTSMQQDINTCRDQKLNLFTVAYQICDPCTSLGNERVFNCLWDACQMDDAEMARGEALGCQTEVQFLTEPDQRGDACPAGSTWDELLDTCLGTFEVNWSKNCVGTQLWTGSKFLHQCHEDCESSGGCSAYSFDVFTNGCTLWSTCTSFVDAEPQMSAYVKDTTHTIFLARGSSFNGGSGGGSSTGPSANYGNGGSSSGSSSTVPDFSSVHSNIDDVHENVNDVHDNLDDLRVMLQQLSGTTHDIEEEVEDVHDAMREIRTLVQSINSNGGAQPNPQNPPFNPYGQNPGYNTRYQPQPQTNSNDDWKTVGIVSAVLTFVLLVGGVIGVSVLFCCMKKN